MLALTPVIIRCEAPDIYDEHELYTICITPKRAYVRLSDHWEEFDNFMAAETFVTAHKKKISYCCMHVDKDKCICNDK